MASKVKTILVTQPKPETEKSPYFELAKKMNVKIDFRPFIHVEGISVNDFRKDRVNVPDYPSVILTSKNAVDHFFRIATELRYTVPDDLKYFCVGESTAYYLQKYVVFRKRKIFFAKHSITELLDTMKKHKKDKFLFPCSDMHKNDIPEFLEQNKFEHTKAILYKTVSSDLSDLANVNYDMLVFFSPSDITSLFKNFPKFKQNKTRIAAFGSSTIQAVVDAGLNVDVKAPIPEAPSMTMAIEQYVKVANK